MFHMKHPKHISPSGRKFARVCGNPIGHGRLPPVPKTKPRISACGVYRGGVGLGGAGCFT